MEEPHLLLAHTADLQQAVLDDVRRLLDAAFAGDFGDDDFEHSLGGMHALVHEDGQLIAHGSVVQRRLVHDGRALRAGYVEAVAVHPGVRRRGHGSRVMAALEGIVRRAYDLGALSTSDEGAPLYRVRGWQPWRGSTWALTPEGRVRTADEDDAVLVLPVAPGLDLDGELTCDWRDGDLW